MASGQDDEMSEYNLACSSNSSPEHNIHTVVVCGTPIPAYSTQKDKQLASTASFKVSLEDAEDEVVGRLRIFSSPSEDEPRPAEAHEEEEI